jgi:hypothetical protein
MCYASISACSLFWTFSWSVSLYYTSCNLMIYLFFTHLPKCFGVAVELLCFIRMAVCLAGELTVLTYFYCFTAYSNRIECYHCGAGQSLQVAWSPYTSYFLMLICLYHVTSETLSILTCVWQQELYCGYLLHLIVGFISCKTYPAVVYIG